MEKTQGNIFFSKNLVDDDDGDGDDDPLNKMLSVGNGCKISPINNRSQL